MTPESTRLDDSDFARWWEETGEYELQQILHWKWDPIGVSDQFPYAADEYHRYAAQVATALRQGAAGEQVAELLGLIEHERMGLDDGTVDHRLAVAANILRWFAASQTRWVAFGPLGR